MGNPHTDKFAYPFNMACNLEPCFMIDVVDAKIRYATVSGKFRIYENLILPYMYRSNLVIDVDCMWYEWQPKRNRVRFIIKNNEKAYFENHKVEYIANIRR